MSEKAIKQVRLTPEALDAARKLRAVLNASKQRHERQYTLSDAVVHACNLILEDRERETDE